MRIFVLLETCELLLGSARAAATNDMGAEAERNLVKLRELLNTQPELEAGGACESAESSKN